MLTFVIFKFFLNACKNYWKNQHLSRPTITPYVEHSLPENGYEV